MSNDRTLSAVFLCEEGDTQLYRVGANGSYRLMVLTTFGVDARVVPQEGAPVVLLLGASGMLRSWKPQGLGERGFNYTRYLEDNGLTFDTQDRRIDVQFWVKELREQAARRKAAADE